jgi:alkylation response protein AidB-like acyl-CoA dehydrogenase
MTDAGTAGHRRMLVDSVADYCRRSDPLHRCRTLRGTEPGFDRGAWLEMAGLGWTALVVPESCAGLGLTVAEHALVAGGTAACLMPEPLTPVMIAARTLAGCIASDAPTGLAHELLAQVASGATLPALAWQEDAGRVDPAAITATARPSATMAGTVVVDGHKRFVVGGAGADGYVLSVHEAGVPALYWVPAGHAGLKVVPHPLADGRSAVDLHCEAMELPAGHRLLAGDAALDALQAGIDDGNLSLAAELLGLSRRLLDLTLDYLRTRSQFGRPIGTFQALQHRAVDLYMHQRIGDATLEQALRMVADARPDGRSALASRVKARACETAARITRESIQMHGAIGFTDDCDVGLYVKRALVLSAWLGNARLHRARYAERVPLDAEAA